MMRKTDTYYRRLTGSSQSPELSWLLQPGVFPEIQVLQDPSDHRRLFNEGENLHVSTALGAFQSIYIPDLLK